MSALLSTLADLADERRAEVERELVPLARSAALGELAADLAHDVANPLFGVIGLVDLMLEDAAAGSESEERLRLLQETTLEMKATLQLLLGVARLRDDAGPAALDEAARTAVALVRRGAGRSVPIEERYPPAPAVVRAPKAAVVQAVLHLLLAARRAGAVRLEVAGGRIEVAPVPVGSLEAVVAERIAADTGGAGAHTGDALALTWPI